MAPPTSLSFVFTLSPMLSIFFLILIHWSARAAASNSSIVCVAGQCLQGASNTTLGVLLSAPDVSDSVILLPGQYTATTDPQLVRDLLTSSQATLASTPGFGNFSLSTLPLNVAVSPGLAIYAQTLYSGNAAFSSLPSSPVSGSSAPLTAQSLAMPSSVWVAMSFGSNGRVVLWDSVPDMSQLPIGSTGSMTLLDMQSFTCSSPCSSSGTCSASGTCSCAHGFNGTSCETCGPGLFGPTCQPCPAGCSTCDEGISGTGRCLSAPVANPLTACNCLNGKCNPDGSCACNPGWVTATNGTACAKCDSGFFATSTGDCKVCALGCETCADGTGACLNCGAHFTQNPNDSANCMSIPTLAIGSDGPCPDGSFSSDGINCVSCSLSCSTCSGPTSNDCTVCPKLSFLTNNGSCVSASSTGVCEGSNLIADNTKGKCDTCGAKCTSCEIPKFSVASTVNELQCTGCLPGTVLSNNQCIDSCPAGTFISPNDNITCTACDSSCTTCSGSPTSCLTCPSNQLAANGKCVSTCPPNTFSSLGACLACHPDCATCTGGSFSQCASCPSDRPVLSNGRCLPTCSSKAQFFDQTSGTCQACDSSCSSCSGSGPGGCLACSSTSRVLRSGTCTATTCTNSTSVVAGLGVCLSDLVVVAATAVTSSSSVSQPTEPTKPTSSPTSSPAPQIHSSARPLAWWEILLMALGCAFIFLLVLMLCRRRMRKRRAKHTDAWAESKRLNLKKSWRWRLLHAGEKLFGHRASPPPRSISMGDVDSEATKMRDAEEARQRHLEEEIAIFGAYGYSREGSTRSSHSSNTPSALPSFAGERNTKRDPRNVITDQITLGSVYSVVTGEPRTAPEPRQPVNKNLLSERGYRDSYQSSVSSVTHVERQSYTYKPASKAPLDVAPIVPVAPLVDVDVSSEAQAYAKSNNPFTKRLSD